MSRSDQPTVLESAKEFLRQGLQPVPIPPGSKAPRIKGWQKLRLTEADLPKYFDGKLQNIGVLLGEASRGAADVDLDAPQAVKVAPVFLAATGMVHGRQSKPRSHHLFIADGIKKTVKFQDLDGTMLVELRSTGAQTVFPPSVHPSGEPIRWDQHGEPARLDANILLAQVATIAACALIARHWPTKGRHDVALALAGWLYRQRWSLAEAEKLVVTAAQAAGDEEFEDRVRAVRDTFETLKTGEPATGKTSLAEFIGQPTVKRLEKFFQIGGLSVQLGSAGSAGSKTDKSDVPADIDAILAQPKVPARIKRREAAQVVVKDLLERGALIHAPGNRQFWFDSAKIRLYDIDAFPFRTHLIQTYRINPAEPEFRHIMEAIKAATREQGKKVNVYRFSHYEREKDLLYVSAGQGKVVRIDGKQLGWVSNGTDGILFEETEDPQVIPDTATALDVDGDPLDEVLLSRVNFARGSGVILSPQQQRLILKIWVLAIFFPELLPSKVLLLLYGEKGSGKSSTLRVILKLLLGPKANVTPLGKEDGFNAAVSQEFLLVLDNVDSRCAWIEDKLATVATGQTIRLRKLYTTNEMVSFPTRCCIGLTARTPRFRRDDVVDRLLILRVDRIEKFESETDWYADVERRRAELWAQILRDLNLVVARLATGVATCPIPLRMADWGVLAGAIGQALQCGDAVRTALEATEIDNASFLLETDALYDLLHDLAHEHPGREWKARDLYAALKTLADGAGNDFSIKSPKSLGRILHRLEPALKLMISFTIRTNPHDGQAVYTMGPLRADRESQTDSAHKETDHQFRDPDS